MDESAQIPAPTGAAPGPAPGARRVRLPKPVLGAILEHARAAAPAECCGALIGRAESADERRVLRALALPNEDASPARYRIAPALVRAAEAEAALRGLEVVGFYHSHPGAGPVPSATDLEWAWPWYTYVIVDVSRGLARAWCLREDRSGFGEEELVGGEGAT